MTVTLEQEGEVHSLKPPESPFPSTLETPSPVGPRCSPMRGVSRDCLPSPGYRSSLGWDFPET